MQFPVPQFTDIEDRIIGPLTIKQFGILFAAGVIIFLAYSASKSLLVAIFFIVLFGLPAIGIAFAKINGRPLYNSFGYFIRFLTSPKVLVFHKEASNHNISAKPQETQSQAPAAAEAVPVDPKVRLKEVNKLLQQNLDKEKELMGEMK